MKDTRNVLILKITILLSIPLGLVAWMIFESLHIPEPWTDDHVNRDATEIQVVKITNAIVMYHLHTGSLPTQLEDLHTDTGIEGWRGPYYARRLSDSYGEPFHYNIEEEHFVVYSNAGGEEKGPIIRKVSLSVFENLSSP